MGQNAPSASLQMMQNPEERLTDQAAGPPFRGTWTGWSNKQRGISWSSATGNAKPWPREEPTRSLGKAGGWVAGKLPCRAGPAGPGWHQADHGPAMCPHGQGGQQPPGLQWAEHCQQAKGGDPSPHLKVLKPSSPALQSQQIMEESNVLSWRQVWKTLLFKTAKKCLLYGAEVKHIENVQCSNKRQVTQSRKQLPRAEELLNLQKHTAPTSRPLQAQGTNLCLKFLGISRYEESGTEESILAIYH